MTTKSPLLSHRISSGKKRSFNDSVAIMLRSYTRAVNKEQHLSGSLFRAHTKAECLNCPHELTPSFETIQGVTRLSMGPDGDYPQTCFNYIHQNPVKAKMVKKAVDYKFSSASDYAGVREGNWINKTVAEKYVVVNVFP